MIPPIGLISHPWKRNSGIRTTHCRNYYSIFNDTFFKEYLWTAASVLPNEYFWNILILQKVYCLWKSLYLVKLQTSHLSLSYNINMKLHHYASTFLHKDLNFKILSRNIFLCWFIWLCSGLFVLSILGFQKAFRNLRISEINQSFLIKPFIYINKKSGKKCKYLKNEKSF